MDIMRSFTVRRQQQAVEPPTSMPIQLGRAASQRGGRPVPRTQISAPLALVSTTNMLSFNAPDIAGTAPIEHRDPSSSSSDESDSSGSIHSHETDPTDISSPEASPTCTEPNHLSQYFKAATEEAALGIRRSHSLATRPSFESPTLPRRAPSHSKRAHEALSRKRSVQRARSVVSSASRSSIDMFSPSSVFVEAPRESSEQLPQLDEIAEDLGATPVKYSEADMDAIYLRNKGLARLDAAAYHDEINSLVDIYLDDNSPAMTDFSGWL